jgi:hypothetical protein
MPHVFLVLAIAGVGANYLYGQGYVVANPSSSLLTLAVLGLNYPAYRFVRLAN